MRKYLWAWFLFSALSLGTVWPDSIQASEIEAVSRIKIPLGYEGIARAGYPVDTILAIDRMHGERRALGLRIQALSKAQRQMLEMGYREPFLIWWPWAPLEGHPAGSLWLLSRYIKEALELRQEQFDDLSEALSHSEYSLRDIDEALARVDDVLNAEASIQGKIILEERHLREKYAKLAREIGSIAPEKMLGHRSIAEAIKAKP